ELARFVAERLGQVLLQLAARPPVLAAEDLQQPLRHLAPAQVVHVEVTGEDPLPGVADPDHLTGKHGAASGGRWCTPRRCRASPPRRAAPASRRACAAAGRGAARAAAYCPSPPG